MHICDFLLVLHSDLGHNLHCFRDIAGFCAPDPTSIPPQFWGVYLHQIAHVGVNVSKDLKLFGHEITFEVF